MNLEFALGTETFDSLEAFDARLQHIADTALGDYVTPSGYNVLKEWCDVFGDTDALYHGASRPIWFKIVEPDAFAVLCKELGACDCATEHRLSKQSLLDALSKEISNEST